MPRRKPADKAHLCWAWRKGLKATGEAAEQRGDTATAERCRCHRLAGGTNGRCRLHGGRSLAHLAPVVCPHDQHDPAVGLL